MTFSFDKVPLIGAAKYANLAGVDPGIGRFSTLLPQEVPPGYVGTQFKTLDNPHRKVQISRSMLKNQKS